MQRFKTADKVRKRNEGGFANNPADSGGMTVFGIARNYWPRWGGWRLVDQVLSGLLRQPVYGSPEYNNWVKVVNRLLTGSPALMNQVEAFFKTNFWDANRIGEIENQDLAVWLYDHAVNGGGRGIKWMQEAADITADGVIGDESIRVFNGQHPLVLLKKSEIVAAWYRIDKVEDKPSLAQFLNSWLARDGVDTDIIKKAREFARDGLSEHEVSQLKEMIKADALSDIREGANV